MKFCLLLLCATLAASSAAVQRAQYGNNNNNYRTTPTKHYTPAQSTANKSNNNDMKEQTVRMDNEIKDDGSYRYSYETTNGIAGGESGVGGVAVEGSSSYISPEGVAVKLTYTADENGYHPVGDHIPKTPDYILRALEYIRTHPYQNENEKVQKQPLTKAKITTTTRRPTAAAHRVSANIAPPTRRSTASRRITPATKTTAKGQFQGNKYRYKY